MGYFSVHNTIQIYNKTEGIIQVYHPSKISTRYLFNYLFFLNR